MSVADLDGDGFPDFVVCAKLTPSLRIFWGGRAGPDPFGVAQPMPTASLSMTLVDVDNDGDRDIATLSGFGLTLVRNNGNRTFGAPVTFSAGGTSPRDLAAGDLNGDGWVDFAVANYGTTEFSAKLLFNLGNGSFGSPVNAGSNGGSGSQIVLSDIDGDGDLDLALQEANFGAIRVQRNQGGGSFAAPVYYAGSGIDALTLADVDGDLDPDMLFVDHLQVVILRNQGGVFSSFGTLPVPAYTMGIAVADLDRDGDADLALAGYNGVRIALNSGSGVFTSSNVAIAGIALFAIEAVDLDHDTDLDLVVSSLEGGSVSWLWNHGDATFASGTQAGGIAQSGALATADLNGNGIPDVVTVGTDARVYLDPGTNLSAPPAAYPAFATPRHVTTADMDGDGDIDVVVARLVSNVVSIGWNHGNGLLTPPSNFPVGAWPACVSAADLDGDGDLDLAVANENGSSISVLLNLGAMQFSAAATYPTATPKWLALGDLDGDLDVDLAVMNTSSNTVSIFPNAGNGTFGPSTSLAMPGYSVAIADLDGDLDLDLVTGASAGINFSQNTGGGTFAAAVQLPGLQSVFHIFATDLDLDGDQDLVGTNTSQQAVLWMQNLGGASFVQLPSVSMPVSEVAFGDVDVDGDIDFITASDLLAGIAIVRNSANSGHVICTGDGSGTACPCGNSSTPGSSSGCLNSTGSGATIRADGPAEFAHDRLVMRIAGMPSDTLAMFLQGSVAESAGAGAVFGDGLRCAGGAIVRLGVAFAPQGSASWPGPSDATLSSIGSITPGSERVYQAWYRNGSSFCTPSSFNLTNGVVVRWGI